MHTVEVDFEVWKELTARRESESVTCNDVLRKLLGLSPKTEAPEPDRRKEDWWVKGVRFPDGTEFQARHKGEIHRGKVENGALVVSGKRFGSPSKAAIFITGNSRNGWTFWEARLPGQSDWRVIKSFRRY